MISKKVLKRKRGKKEGERQNIYQVLRRKKKKTQQMS